MATADLGEDSRDIGVGDTPQQAVKVALSSLGEPYASEMAEDVRVDDEAAASRRRHGGQGGFSVRSTRRRPTGPSAPSKGLDDAPSIATMGVTVALCDGCQA